MYVLRIVHSIQGQMVPISSGFELIFRSYCCIRLSNSGILVSRKTHCNSQGQIFCIPYMALACAIHLRILSCDYLPRPSTWTCRCLPFGIAWRRGGPFFVILRYTRNKKFLLKNDEDVGMKKTQKQDIIHNGRIFGFLYPFLHST